MAKRPNILKLATKISLESMTYMGITYDDPEYKILEPIIDDDMCAIMMHVRLETNRTVEEVAKQMCIRDSTCTAILFATQFRKALHKLEAGA